MTDVAPDPVEEVRRLLTAANGSAVPVRAIGGVAVALIAPTIGRLSPTRTYHDIDLAATGPAGPVSELLGGHGYEAARRFNALNGSERLLFHDPAGRRVDVFIGTLRMCHTLPFATRIATHAWTLPPADLVLSKLQIVELTERDAQDLLALLADHPLTPSDGDGIAIDRIEAVCGGDWGWWRTVDDNLRRLIERWRAERLAAAADSAAILERGIERAVGLRGVLADAPRSVGWRLRAIVGPRVRWYDEPEEVR
ncbi:MAG TPA: hypothetical protein VGQ31_13565 [Candidatus Limnocylindrales bacterium]|jgi:hypothetical protein|nr:hypothetical protein [Candidatus Limnocylindrales bacterium]